MTNITQNARDAENDSRVAKDARLAEIKYADNCQWLAFPFLSSVFSLFVHVCYGACDLRVEYATRRTLFFGFQSQC